MLPLLVQPRGGPGPGHRLAELRGVWLPGMAKAGRLLMLEPSADGEGIVCDPEELLADLE